MVAAHRFHDDKLTLLELLTQRVRVATVEQLYDLFHTCRRRHLPPSFLTMLTDSGLLRQETLVLAVPDAEQPLFSWAPGEPTPAFAVRQWHLRQRAQTATNRRVTVVQATPQAAQLVGGSAGLGRQPLQVQHDLRTTVALLGYLRHDPSVYQHWLGEDVIPLHLPGLFPRKRPDAVILTEQDTLARIVEAGGAYSARQLRKQHQAYARLGVPYDIW